MTNQPTKHSANINIEHGYQMESDEISLIDLWLVLTKRKKMIGLVVLICVVAGFVMAFSTTNVYKYYTTLEVGTKIVEGKIQVIEDPKQLLAKIEGAYIPTVLSGESKNNGTDEAIYALEAVIPKNSEIIEISGKGTLADQEQYFMLLTAVVDSVKVDHSELVKVLKQEEAIKRNKLLSAKEGLNDKYTLVQNKLKRLEHAEALLKDQIKETNALIDSGLKNRDKAIKQAKDEAHAMTVMMIDNGLQNNRTSLAELENKLYIVLANERDALQKELADVLREKSSIDLEAEKLLLHEGTYRNTRVILKPVRSLSPVGQSKRLILVLSAVIGLFIAIFAAFFAEFLTKVKEREMAQD